MKYSNSNGSQQAMEKVLKSSKQELDKATERLRNTNSDQESTLNSLKNVVYANTNAMKALIDFQLGQMEWNDLQKQKETKRYNTKLLVMATIISSAIGAFVATIGSYLL